ncbi:M20 family metallopeptidase [Planctomycetota bacterium]
MKELLKKLVQADSTPAKGELLTAQIIAEHLKSFGIEPIVDSWDNNRANIIAVVNSSGQKPALVFVTHLDVVPSGAGKWQTPPFEAIEKDGKIFGRGSGDMKGGIVAIITAIEEIVKSKVKLQGDIIFSGTAGEETDSCGIKRFVKVSSGQLPELAGIVIPEPTDFEIVTAHRGMLWLEITTKGKTAHGSMPRLGINAIDSMMAVLGRLEAYKKQKLPAGCSMSINTIAGGKAVNVIPDNCTVAIDLRTEAGKAGDCFIDDLKNIFAELNERDSKFKAEVSVIRNVGALETDNDCDFVKTFCKAVEITETRSVGFCTDGPFLADLAPVIIFGPGRPDLAHKPDEYIDLADVKEAAQYYKEIIFKFLT